MGATTDRDALAALFRSTGGDTWHRKYGWDTNAELSCWHGVKVNVEGRVVKLSLAKNNLEGQIPETLGRLSELKELILFGNQLTGCIPKTIAALSKLEMLWFATNQLTGTIPLGLGELGALQVLDLSGNELSALWDHSQDMPGVRQDEGTSSESGGRMPSQLCQLLDVLDGCRGLDLGDNPWVEPPESIVREGMQNTREYFQDLYAESYRVQRNSVKIILVGQEGAGKTRSDYPSDQYPVLQYDSSLRQSMKANKPMPTGDWKEESTVFADMEPMELVGTSVRVYDCAGQVAYTGLLQMFLTPRSVCALVCNAAVFDNPDNRSDGQVEEDCRKLEELRVCDWLRSISRRVPGNDVILVATKCDLVGSSPREAGRRIEQACRTWLASWIRPGMQPVRVEDGVCLTSCCALGIYGRSEGSRESASEGGWACDWRDSADENPSPPSLLHRLVSKRDGGGLRGAQMVLPRSWDIALTVLEALENGRDPVEMTLQKFADGGEAAELEGSKGGLYQGITVEELSAKWQETTVELAKRDITVTHAQHALEGALLIREFEGSVVRHERFVFLDVIWLARFLKPLLNHKDEETFDGFVRLGGAGDTHVTLEAPLDIASWGRLRSKGILEPRLAQAMWPAGLSEYVLPTLLSLGLAFPLQDDPAEGMVVLLRLDPGRPARVGEVMESFRSNNTPVFSASWTFFLGVPPGAAEKVLTQCCRIGGVQTFWRFGVLVHGGFGDEGDGSGVFAVVLEHLATKNELTAQVYGDISNPAPWVALSFVMSAVRSMLLEFPGLRWKGFLQCPQHGDAMPLSTTATHAGDPLLLESSGCPQCSPEINGQGAAAVELLSMVDIRLDRDDVFREVKARFGNLEGQYRFRRPRTKSGGEEVLLRKIDNLAATVKEGFDETCDGLNKVQEGLSEVKGELDKVAESLQESLMCVKNLQAPGYPYPHLVVVEAIETPGGGKSLLSKLRGMATEDMRLHFLCPVDMSKVPCGANGDGYRFRKTRGWVKKLSPALQVTAVTAKVALRAVAGVDVDMSSFLKAVKDGLVEEVADCALDEDALLRVVAGEEDAGTDMQRDARASYEALKKFMDKENLNRRKKDRVGDGYVDFREKMQLVSDGKGGMVWVRNENVDKWRVSLSAGAPSR